MKEEFIEFCSLVNKKCIELQNSEKEYISDILAFEAYSYITQMKLELDGDFLLFVSSLNLLNTYVKQVDSKIDYSFKKQIDYFLEVCLRVNKGALKINKVLDGKNDLLIIQINDLQFSFHSVNCRYSGIKENLSNDLKWDGVRKQLCSVTIFELCKQNNLLRCNITYRGKCLDDKINRFVDNYKKGIMNFDTKLM